MVTFDTIKTGQVFCAPPIFHERFIKASVLYPSALNTNEYSPSDIAIAVTGEHAGTVIAFAPSKELFVFNESEDESKKVSTLEDLAVKRLKEIIADKTILTADNLTAIQIVLNNPQIGGAS